MPETREETAERLAPVAVAVVLRIRAEDVDQLNADLLAGLSHRDLTGLVMMLAAAVDPNVDPELWWGWKRYAEELNRAREASAEEADGEPAELSQAQIAERLAELAGHRSCEIAAATGLTVRAVEGRKRRAARAGVA